MNPQKLWLVCFVFLLFPSCRKSLGDLSVSAYKTEVKTYRVTSEEIRPWLDSYGNISYTRKADITASLEGTYEELYFQEGDKVFQGDTVALLSNLQIEVEKIKKESSIVSAEAGLELAEARLWEAKKQVEAQLLGFQRWDLEIQQKEREVENLRRIKEDQLSLFNVGGITESSLRAAELAHLAGDTELKTMIKSLEIQKIGFRDKDILARGLKIPPDREDKDTLFVSINTAALRAEKEVAAASLESAKTEEKSLQILIDELSVESPITGIVGARTPEVGEKAKEGDSIYTVFDIKDVHVVFLLQESDVVLLRKGMTVMVTLDSFHGEEFTAMVDRIAPLVDPQSGNVTVKALIKNANEKLIPGMFARVRVATENPYTALLIPESALLEKQNDKGVVYTIKNNKSFSKKLSLGRRYQDKIEVLDNLEEGEMVIDEPSPLLRDGEEVIYAP